jgi:hypothetical protein
MQVQVKGWWKAKEIPLGETDWRNIRLYWTQEADFWDWKDTSYFIRLAPPFCIRYGEVDSPLVYIGSGAIQNRWPNHRDKLRALGETLPGGRYEIWVMRDAKYEDIEADALLMFRSWTGFLPLINRKVESDSVRHKYEKDFLSVADADRRYWWAVSPRRPDIEEYLNKGAKED